MEALFSTTLASYEAWLILLCVIVFFGIYLFDGISFLERVYTALRPAKPQGAIVPLVGDESIPEVVSPILEPIAPEEVEAHDREKALAEEKHEQEVIESEVFEEKILEEIQSAEEAEKIEQIEEAVETKKGDEDEAIPVISSEAIAESMCDQREPYPRMRASDEVGTTHERGEDTPQEAEKEDTHEESEEAVENDLEEKEKIEEELLDVTEEIVESESTQEVPENKIEKTAEVSEGTLEEDIIEIEPELQDETGEVGEEIVPVISSEAIAESMCDQREPYPRMRASDEVGATHERGEDLAQTSREEVSILQRESEEEADNIKEVGEKPSDVTESTIEEQASPEEAHALPITASIPEIVPEARKSTESQHAERLYTITNETKTLIARGRSQDARALIIEGLSLDKNHRELNLILGSIYESERQAQKAEYIYKDLALAYPEDGEILERLANILIIEKRYDLALEIYKKIISISPETEGSLYIMTHLAHELGHHEELYAYARRYQKNWPNNPDILTLLAQAEIALGERQSAIQTLIKLKNLTPYNNEIMETIAKLTMEEELAGNFASRENSQNRQ